MRPAERELDVVRPSQGAIASVFIDLEHAMEAVEMGLGALCLPIWRVDLGHCRRVSSTPWAVIARIGP